MHTQIREFESVVGQGARMIRPISEVSLGFRVSGLGFRGWGLGFGVCPCHSLSPSSIPVDFGSPYIRIPPPHLFYPGNSLRKNRGGGVEFMAS